MRALAELNPALARLATGVRFGTITIAHGA
jgi:hypothetical protein